MVLRLQHQLSLPPVTYLQLPERLPSVLFVLRVAGFGKVLRLIGPEGGGRRSASRVGVAHRGVLPEVVERRGDGRGGRVLRRAALQFDAEVEGGHLRRGRGARLGGEGAPPSGHPGNSTTRETLERRQYLLSWCSLITVLCS